MNHLPIVSESAYRHATALEGDPQHRHHLCNRWRLWRGLLAPWRWVLSKDRPEPSDHAPSGPPPDAVKSTRRAPQALRRVSLESLVLAVSVSPSSAPVPDVPVRPLAGARARGVIGRDGQRRLGPRPGRPRKTTNPGHDAGHDALQPTGNTEPKRRYKALQAPAQVAPRLLDVPAAGVYLGGLKPRTVWGLIAKGTLRRVHIPLPNGGELRRVLVDRQELDALIERGKA